MPTSLLAAALVLDDEGLVTDANALALALLGRPRAQLLGRSFGSVVEGSRPDGTPVRCKTLRSQQMDGTTLCLLREVHGDEFVEDLSAYFDAAFDHAPIGMAILGADGRYVRVNDALCAMLGRSRATLMGERDNELTHPDDRARDVELAWRILRGELDSVQLEKRFLRPDGSVVWVISNMTYLRDDTGDQVQRQTKLRSRWRAAGHGESDGFVLRRKGGARFHASITSALATGPAGESLGNVVTVRDISDRKLHEAELARLATHDALTGLANHHRFHERLAEEIARGRRHGTPVSVAILDLDHFKQINDTNGHPAGDRVLAEVGARFRALTRTGEEMARVGGEEFAWILPATDGAGAYAAAERAAGDRG